MTWTYDPTDLSTDIAKVRLYIGDTNTNDQGLTDEEIQSFIDLGLSVDAATLRAAQALYGKWVRDVDRSNLGMSVSRSQKLQHLKDLIDGYLSPRVKRRASPFVGGVSQDSKDALEDDSDFIQPSIRRGQFENI
jgi:hypothetical protein